MFAQFPFLIQGQPAFDVFDQKWELRKHVPELERWMLTDLETYLDGDILAKVDRASMAVSLEARVPILDHRVVEMAWKLPRHFKVRHGRGKWILRQVLYKHVPAALADRQKMGFSVPLATWLSGPLRDWAGDLVLSGQNQEFLRADVVKKKWDQFLAGDTASAPGIWALVMFCAWQERWLSPLSPQADPLKALSI